MSVAFRRESDEEHKEPRFEIPIPVGPNLVTSRGLRLIQERVTALEAEIAANPEEIRLAEAKRDLRYWRTRLATAQVAPPPPGDEAAFGSRVTFRMGGATRTLDIVGDDEADPAQGSISFSAPLARALIGAGPGDHADFGSQADAIEIVQVSPIEPV
jgi:transcription elongation GreA/GreB family factor